MSVGAMVALGTLTPNPHKPPVGMQKGPLINRRNSWTDPLTMAEPGAFFVIQTHSKLGLAIDFAESVMMNKFVVWNHAGICSRVEGDTVWIVEAEPDGAQEHKWHYQGYSQVLWSTGRVKTSPQAALYARHYAGQPEKGYDPTAKGVPYSDLDYVALAAHYLHLPLPGLRDHIEDSHHMICSQLVDQCEFDAGVHLFNDGRWPGYVTPGDLGYLIQGSM